MRIENNLFDRYQAVEVELMMKKIQNMLDFEVTKCTMTYHPKEEARLAIANRDALVALHKNVVVGYVDLVHWKNYVEISALVVDEKHRYHGIGSALIKEIIRLAKTKYPEKELIALTNDVSCKIICKHGFVQKEKSWFLDEIWQLCSGCQEEKLFPNCHCAPLVYEGSVNIVKISDVNDELIDEIARLYCEIWKEPPWNEDFWKAENVSKEICDHLLSPHAVIVVALEKKRVVGFSWGKSVGKQGLGEISSGANLNYIFGSQARVFYVNELAVDKEMRNRNIGSLLAKFLVELANKNGFEKICLRTDQEAIAAQRVYSKIGFRDLAIEDGKHSNRTYWLLN